MSFDAVSKGGGAYFATLDRNDSLADSWTINSSEGEFQMLKSDKGVQIGRWSYQFTDSPYARTACCFILIGLLLECSRWLFRVHGAPFLRKCISKLGSDNN